LLCTRVLVDFTGLIGNTTASHIHCCAGIPGVSNSGVATQLPTFVGFPLGVTAGTYDHTFDLTLASSWSPAFVTANGGTTAGATAALHAGLDLGRAYLNVHTSAFGGGEIRGYLHQIPEPTSLMLTALAGFSMTLVRRRRPR